MALASPLSGMSVPDTRLSVDATAMRDAVCSPVSAMVVTRVNPPTCSRGPPSAVKGPTVSGDYAVVKK